MANRQRKRAQSIIRCLKNDAYLSQILAEEQEINKIRKDIGYPQLPRIITFEKGKLKVLDVFSKLFDQNLYSLN